VDLLQPVNEQCKTNSETHGGKLRTKAGGLGKKQKPKGIQAGIGVSVGEQIERKSIKI
jgi:hypothetical protein